MEKWLVYAKKADFEAIGKRFNISPVLARIIRNRDVIEINEFETYLNCDLNTLNSPFLFKDMDKSIDRIHESIQNKEKIRIVGDYDIDGVCAGFILKDGFKRIGANVDFDVPDRINDGYGINDRIIKQAFDDGVNLIITCDNGIAAGRQIDYAHELGMKIIVTDHHEVPYIIEGDNKVFIIPNADAVIDHKRYDCEYPFKHFCGAMIAYKLLEAFMEKYHKIYFEDYNFIDEKIKFFDKYLVFAGIATIGDVVPLMGENRVVVKNALKIIKEIDNYGLKALIKVNELWDKEINSYHISFVIGPCINSGGRIDTAKRVFSLFDCENMDIAMEMAMELKSINDERKDMTVKGVERAIEQIETSEELKNEKVLIVYLNNCHESLAGIIAGRLKEKYYKPVFVFTNAENGIKGSGRSIEGYSMFDELIKANQLYKEEKGEDLFIKFGGHEMAAGVSVERKKFADMKKILNNSNVFTEDLFIQKIWIDIPLPFEYIKESFIEELEVLEPFGVANEKPVFAEKCIGVERIRVFGQNRNVISMTLRNNSGYKMETTYFKEEELFKQELTEKFGKEKADAIMEGRLKEVNFNILYYPEINEYRGYRNIRVVVKRIS